jgi:hypothetical protein
MRFHKEEKENKSAVRQHKKTTLMRNHPFPYIISPLFLKNVKMLPY